MNRYDKEMQMIARAYRTAFAGTKVVKTKVSADDMKEMKSKLAELGYKYVTNGKAYKTAEDLGTERFIKIVETDEGYSTVVSTLVKR